MSSEAKRTRSERFDVASRRVLTDRIVFALGPDSIRAWERVNERPSRDLGGLRALMKRPSPFAREK